MSEDPKNVLDYADRKIPESEAKPRHFKLDVNVRRNLRSLLILFLIGLLLFAGVLILISHI